MKWPAHNIRKAQQRDRKLLAEWLAEWDLDQQLGDDDSQEYGAVEPIRSIPGMYDKDTLREGDIRLLVPTREGTATDVPLYVALLPGEERGTLTWIPFGRFSTPAMSSEWRTGMKHAALRVLCFWNARRVEKGRGPRSWFVKRLTDRQTTDILLVQRAVEGGGALADRLRRRLGPPLVHPADPRHVYQAEERDRMAWYFTDQWAQSVTEEEEGGPYLSEWAMDPVAWLLAAESREKYGVACAIYVTDDDAVVVAVYEEERAQIRIRIMNRDGFPSVRYDGGHVEAVGGAVSSPIKDGCATAPSQLAESLQSIIDQDGGRTPLYRKYRQIPK